MKLKRSALTLLAATAWFPMVKNVVLRSRPYMAHPEEVRIEQVPEPDADPMDIVQQGYSFPSGHSAMSLAIFGSIARESRKKWTWILAILLPLLVGISRVAVGAHYPTDVFGGWALGALIVLLIPWLKKTIKNRWLFYGILLLTTVPGFFFCKSNDYFSSFGMLLGFMFAEPFEERFVRFENTKNVVRCILRTIGGGLIYFGLNTVLKMPFPDAILNPVEPTFLANLIRTLRYAIVIFVVIGVYPMLFKLTAKIGKKPAAAEENA